jgi:hypothetical protein
MKMEQTTYEDGEERSETSAHKIQVPRKYPKERIQHTAFPRNSAVFFKVAKNLKASENNRQRRLEQYVLRKFPNLFKAVSLSVLLLLLLLLLLLNSLMNKCKISINKQTCVYEY